MKVTCDIFKLKLITKKFSMNLKRLPKNLIELQMNM